MRAGTYHNFNACIIEMHPCILRVSLFFKHNGVEIVWLKTSSEIYIVPMRIRIRGNQIAFIISVH